MGFGYNGRETDLEYNNLSPPAIGYLLLQGPIIPASYNDSASVNGYWIKGYKNLGMTSFGPLLKNWWEGIQGWGTKEHLYNNMRGLNTLSATPLIDPNTGLETVPQHAG